MSERAASTAGVTRKVQDATPNGLSDGNWFSRIKLAELFFEIGSGLDGFPWGHMNNGKGITVEWLAKQLERHGIRPKTIRIGETQAKGYYEEDFKEVFPGYMSASDMEKVARIESALPPVGLDPVPPPLLDCRTRAAHTAPSSSGSGATSQENKDEPGEVQGADAAAA